MSAGLLTAGLPADVEAFALGAMGAVVREADPGRAVLESWPSELDGERWVRVIAFGKASARMTNAAFARLGTRVAESVVLTPPSLARTVGHPKARVFPVDHPSPTARNIEAARAVAACAMGAHPKDEAVLVLISGGGSAHLTLPRSGVTLEDIARVSRELMLAGAPIGDLNTVRRAMEQLKGGGLRAVCSAGMVRGLVVSDVVGDDVGTVASGPLTPGEGTGADALAVLDGWGVEAEGRLRGVIGAWKGARNDEGRPPAEVRVVLSGRMVAERLEGLGHAVGMPCVVLDRALTGEASEAGGALAARAAAHDGATLAWGETTVTVGEAGGHGGRNLELALACALEMRASARGRRWGVMTLATDGVDGPTDAAGAVLCSEMFEDEGAWTAGAEVVRRHDSYPFIERLGGLVKTGPTGTNVNDVSLAWWR